MPQGGVDIAHRVIAIITDPIGGREATQQLKEAASGGEIELRLIAPAVEANPLRHTLGDIDEPKREAQEKLDASLTSLRAAGLEASGAVGDPDPIQAAKDALLEAPADEVVIFEREAAESRWYEGDLTERAEEELEPPLRIVTMEARSETGEPSSHVIDVEQAPEGTLDHQVEHEVGSAYLPGLSRGDFAGMVAGVVGTIVVIVLAAAIGSESNGPETGWQAVAIGAAIAVALVNMAHVVGLLLMESVRYRGGFARFFRTLSLTVTPAAIVLNLIILVS
jgi:hypothetical protein